ncbi:LP04173p, putative [Brugia malayi]|uniref:RING-type E3 ubiquitin transferase n=1 Tax=Brugia malayi TaxID=6279 RepID=A0A0I9NB31_BRUMA|nr:LP04173p, putative [Brugia malayi]CTP81828.1 BMA-MARC-6 [Brugia malayi]VIO95998.1 LP04173p, putative [Brugia malayi]
MGSVDNSSTNAPLNPVAGTSEMVDDGETTDICRVCRSAGDSALYYPCLCTGSIKYVHQDCLLEWLKYSKKEVCELCSHKYSFQPIYRSDMPQTLPLSEIIRGILLNMGRILRCWAIYTLVLVAWLGIVPITACRIYRIVFSASLSNMLSLPFQLFSPDNLLVDCLKGCFIVSIFLCAFISLVWLREQIIHGGPQEWLNLEDVARGANAENALDDNVDAVVAEARVEIAGNDIEGGEVEERGDDVEQGQEDVAVQDQADNDNWREWERVADELTWQRLLGLDGSLLFLEHVFWVISLNTLFTVLFAFLPYQLGHFFLKAIGLSSRVAYFPTLTSVLLGYFILSLIVRCLHVTAKISRLAPMYRILGMCYLVLKVFLLVLTEIGFFPIICGWWLDICSLPLFASSLSRRIASFVVSPTSSLFMHWLIGMVYVFYSASFVLVLREVLRPGVLWFLRNLNDPEFNPIQEMIELPVIRHLRRLIASTSIFFTTILLLVYVPLCFITRYIPSVLPFNLSLAAETPVSELSLELLVLQVVLPALLEQTHARTILKTVVRTWCCIFGRLLQLEHYLLPMEENENGRQQREAPPVQPVAGLGLAAQHQALLLVREPQGFQAYNKPSHFSLRVVALLIALSLTSMFTSIIFCVIPVTFGRFIVHRISGHTNIHDLYTVAAGLYGCWILLKLFFLVLEYAPQGTFFLFSAFRNMALTAVKLCAVSVPILIVIPLLAGISFHLAVISPIRIALHQTSLLFPWQHWAMGILHCKIFCAAVMMGPNWWMKHVFEQLYADGIRGLRVHYLYKQLVAPVLACLAIHLSAPRVICSLISMIIDVSNEEQIIFLRYSYPAMLLCVFCVYFVYWQCTKFKALAEKIRNDKYLVGTQLVNYERNQAEVRH